MEKNDRSYFMRRAAQERSAADRASDQAARDAHLQMAQRYRKLVGASKETKPTHSAPA
jgi:hypothetical protein